MRLLVDTHALLWAIDSPEKLGQEARDVLTAPGQRIFVSTVSLWEIAIKISLDRLDLDPDWREIIESGLEHMHGRWLTIKPAHCGIVLVSRLPFMPVTGSTTSTQSSARASGLSA